MRTWCSGVFGVAWIALALVACGSSAPPPADDETSGHEEPPPPPPPPPPPASVRIVHASADPGLSTISLALDGRDPLVRDLAATTASPATEIAAGSHPFSLRGVASIETGEAPEVLTGQIELAQGSHPIVLVVGEPAAEPPLSVSVLDEDASGTSTRARVVHGLVGVAAVDVCVGGAAIAAALGPGATSSVTPIAEGSAAIEVHAANDTPCSGRVLGIAHATLAASTPYVIALAGRPARRGHVSGSAVVCSEGASGACEAAAFGTR